MLKFKSINKKIIILESVYVLFYKTNGNLF